MQIAPDNLPTALEARPYHAGKPTTARPPQIEAREHQHDRPARGQFDQPASALAEQQLPVDALVQFPEARFRGEAAQHFALRSPEDVPPPIPLGYTRAAPHPPPGPS